MPDQPLSLAAKQAALEILALVQRTSDLTDDDVVTSIAEKVQDAIDSANDANIGVMRQIVLVLGPTESTCEGCSAEIGEALALLREAGITYEP